MAAAEHLAAGRVTLHHGDSLDLLTTLPEASVDAVVTDPPYGLEFMGKDWDAPWKGDIRQPGDTTFTRGTGPFGRAKVRHGGTAAYASNAEPMRHFQSWCQQWAAECLRVLKPGGHLLAFGGTRTYHRLACAVEDAGFEIRDSITWIYGSGFPKSLDVSKAIDKAAGAEREDVYESKVGVTSNTVFGAGLGVGVIERRPATRHAERWQGWGTALKPASEPVVVARKPLGGAVNVRGRIEHELRSRGVTGDIRWTDLVSDAAPSKLTRTSGSTRQRPTVATSARTASGPETLPTEKPTERCTGEQGGAGGLITPSEPVPKAADATGNSASRSSTSTDPYAPVAERRNRPSSRSTTSTEGEVSTERPSTERSTPNFVGSASLTVTESFAGTATGLTGSLTSVRIDRLSDGAFVWPDGLPMSVAGGSTVAANVVAHGTGALNIDGCRVGTDAMPVTRSNGQVVSGNAAMAGPNTGREIVGTSAGRWPSNVVLTHAPDCVQVGERRVRAPGGYRPDVKHVSSPPGSALAGSVDGSLNNRMSPSHGDADGMEAVAAFDCAPGCPVAELDQQSGAVKASGMYNRTDGVTSGGGANYQPKRYADSAMYDDVGGASRFFPVFKYEAKAPASERPRNGPESHPTCKPLGLMRWLVRLVTPPGGVVLDPFAGSGTTGEAAIAEGFTCVLMEREAAYLPLIRNRLNRRADPVAYLAAAADPASVAPTLFDDVDGAA